MFRVLPQMVLLFGLAVFVVMVDKTEAGPGGTAVAAGLTAVAEALGHSQEGHYASGCNDNGYCWAYCGRGKPVWCYTFIGVSQINSNRIPCTSDDQCPSYRSIGESCASYCTAI